MSLAGFQSETMCRVSLCYCEQYNSGLTRVKQDEAVRTDQIDTTPAGFRRQEEDDLARRRVVELIDEFLTLRDGLRAVEAEPAESAGDGQVRRVSSRVRNCRLATFLNGRSGARLFLP